MGNLYIDRFNSFCRSLDTLSLSCNADPDKPFVLAATAQSFNLTFDLSWKLMKDVLLEHFGISDFAAGSPKETLRAAFSVGLIADDTWLKMLHVKNTLIHDYNGVVAENYFKLIITDYFSQFQMLKEALQKIVIQS
ncbi:MAG: nucleotidyltransferase substrate binding protein [Lachnospiraceae bacterium]|nr:nucleotidyltransferase substrate binding protein [Lachnospiraceae bacterium]